MELKLIKSFGEITIQTADDKDAIAQASFWSELPDLCPMCAAGLYLHFRITKEGDYKYYELYCQGKPKHFTQFGQYKTGGLFYKAESWAEHTFNSVQSERDVEINRFGDQPKNAAPNGRAEIIGRIKRANLEINNLGGKVEKVDLDNMSLPELDDEFESLTAQY